MEASSEQEGAEPLLGHSAESDGIEEYDNPMPNWWVGMFYLTIFWAIAYVAYYHFIAKKSYAKALAVQVAEAEARWPKSSQLATVEETPAAIEAGEDVYKANCVACHGAELQGASARTWWTAPGSTAASRMRSSHHHQRRRGQGDAHVGPDPRQREDR
jgi:hypothetical protein